MIQKNLYKKISGIYAITPDKTLDLNLAEQAIEQHQINILQYRQLSLMRLNNYNSCV